MMRKLIALVTLWVIASVMLILLPGSLDDSVVTDDEDQPLVLDPDTTTNHGNITMDIILASYRVINRSVSGTSGVTNTGTAFAIYEDDSFTYLITNAHVVKVRDGYQSNEITLIDYHGVESTAILVEDTFKSNYDLAIIKIQKNDNPEIKLLDVPYQKGQVVKAVGYYPSVSITTGTITNTTMMNYIVNMVVIAHDAYIVGGASGGPLLNSSNQVIGINFAAVTSNGQFLQAYAIPINKIIEYLTLHFPEALNDL
jgi:S1-C subfamily serine protease